MKMTRSAKLHISFGNFEWKEIGLEIEEDFEDGYSTDIAAETLGFALHAGLAKEIENARVNTAEAKSFIHFEQAYEGDVE